MTSCTKDFKTSLGNISKFPTQVNWINEVSRIKGKQVCERWTGVHHNTILTYLNVCNVRGEAQYSFVW